MGCGNIIMSRKEGRQIGITCERKGLGEYYSIFNEGHYAHGDDDERVTENTKHEYSKRKVGVSGRANRKRR